MSTNTHHHIGLIGSAISTSLSPDLHNREASRLGLDDYSYELIELDMQADPGRPLHEAISAGYTGFNVTHPFKQTIIDSLDELSDDARMLGAVNTIAVRDGKSIGFNTDHTGFMSALRTGLPGAELGRVALIGAGGAGSAVAFALAAAGVTDLRICDVDRNRSQELCDRLSQSVTTATATPFTPDAIESVLATSHGVVNASPIGMTGHPGTPFTTAALRASIWVADIVYRPMQTELISAARAARSPVLDGGRMLVAQAADTFTLLTGAIPDRDRMRRHLTELVVAQSIAA
ncbi:shikimate dehydrogenase [Rhodococcus sp. 14-1411-2a]|uniref:shikimate dehydrogenase n=1 Tax=Rhodococcus sp. 14-1411-2a TaxID=2023151 RepID=UPI000B9B313C|nr:shikimate dehydrogenase [Rhodococcus sp. 14-1411-2a]OZF51930.1 shikimate dehydrogenase [Rhodococcus sp. 14-1411-2a]